MFIDDILEGTVPLTKPLILFFLIDSSDDAKNRAIEHINSIMKELMSDMDELLNEICGFRIYIALLQFSSSAQWLTSSPVNVDDFSWKDIKQEFGHGEGFVDAIEKLNEKLSRHGFMWDPISSPIPMIFLVSLTQWCDACDEQLYQLQQNHWFQRAPRFAFPTSDEHDGCILSKFTGSNERVFANASNYNIRKTIIEAIKQEMLYYNSLL